MCLQLLLFDNNDVLCLSIYDFPIQNKLILIDHIADFLQSEDLLPRLDPRESVTKNGNQQIQKNHLDQHRLQNEKDPKQGLILQTLVFNDEVA